MAECQPAMSIVSNCRFFSHLFLFQCLYILIVFVYVADEAGSTDERGSTILVYIGMIRYFCFCLNKLSGKKLNGTGPIILVICVYENVKF